MKLNEAFPSNFLKAEDIQGREVKATISGVKLEKMNDGNKLLISFYRSEKSLMCNKTNANRIAHFFGTDTDLWLNKEITLGTELVDFQGQTKLAIRVKNGTLHAQPASAPSALEAQAPAGPAPAPTPPTAQAVPFNDEIPF